MSFGPPDRAPCGGWPETVPPYPNKGGINPADNGIPKYTPSPTPAESFTTVGSDVTDPCPAAGTNLTGTPDNGWIGTGAYQGTLVPDYDAGAGGLSTWAGTLGQTWAHTPGENLNFAVCHKAGKKVVACCLQWNGSFGYSNPEGVTTANCVQYDFGYTCDQWTVSAGTSVWHRFEPRRATPYSQNKYTAVDISATYVATVSNPLGSTENPPDGWSLSDSRVMHIENSGEVVLDSGSDIVDPSSPPPGGYIVPFPTSLLSRGVAGGLNDGQAFVGFAGDWHDTLTYTCECNTASGAANGTEHVSGKCTRISDGAIMEIWEANFGTGEFTRDFREHITIGGVDYGGGYLETLTISETVYAYEKKYWGETETNYFYEIDSTLTATLSSANTGAMIFSHSTGSHPTDGTGAKELLAWWPLNDDKLYPWRSPTDGFLQVAPMVSLNQVPNNISFSFYAVDSRYGYGIPPLKMNDKNGVAPGGGGYIDTPWQDPTVWRWVPDGGGSSAVLVQFYDGTVLGNPEPAGYQDAFCYQFEDWEGACGGDGSGDPYFFRWCLHGRGMKAGSYNTKLGIGGMDLDGNFSGIPLNATLWTDNQVCRNKTPGGYIGYCDNTIVNGPKSDSVCDNASDFAAARTGALWFYKYAEILDTWPSQNFARPGGADKFLIDETNVFFVTGTTLTKQDGTSASPDITSGLWGGKCVDGFYSGCSCSGGVVTLGTKVFSVPSDWKSKSIVPVAGGSPVDDTDTIFGQLRFESATIHCPSLLGRAAIKMVGTTATFGATQTAFGMAVAGTETVDIYDASMTLLSGGSGVTATWASETTFTLAVNYSTAAYVMIHGASAKWYMNDTTSKGKFSTLQFTYDARNGGGLGNDSETTRLAATYDCGYPPVALSNPDANYGFSAFSQTQHCLTMSPCAPRVICFSPNGEVFLNGITIDMPAIDLDERYGSKKVFTARPTMSDLFFQAPHKPSNDAVEAADFLIGFGTWWKADDGTCKAPVVDPGSGALISLFYPINVPVECELALPGTVANMPGYGVGQDEQPPALPSGIVIGWSSPVDAPAANTAYPPGPSSFTDTGIPIPFFTDSQLHYNFCHLPGDCVFAAQYADGKNGC